MRTIIDYEPYAKTEGSILDQGIWPADWICYPGAGRDVPVVFAYRCLFHLEVARTIRVHVSADERYDLFLDGVRVGRGPERGDPGNWFFETYDFELSAGDHLFVARVWSTGATGPYAQMSTRPAFLMLAEGEPHGLLNTGEAAWMVKRLGGYAFEPAPRTILAGGKWRIDGSSFDWRFEFGEGEAWTLPARLCKPRTASMMTDDPAWWLLTPSTLPPMLNRPFTAGVLRHVGAIDSFESTRDKRVLAASHIESEAQPWRLLLAGAGSVVIGPQTRRRAIIDLENYYCAYPALTLSGAGATVRMHWAESLYEIPEKELKGNRNEIDGKLFVGSGDVFVTGDGVHTYEPLWWESGRYIEIAVETGDAPLTIESLALTETRYPHVWRGRFESSDPRLESVIPIGLRTLEMCSHETYFDCPYYEQLMYAGDTRLEVLTTYAMSADDRLPRKALKTFDRSRINGGLTQSRFPCRIQQIIPPFSLWWVAMAHDFAFWRHDPDFVASLMPGVRAVLEAWRTCLTDRGLVTAPVGWNFTDWVTAWDFGTPPDGRWGISGILNWHFAMVLNMAAELEEMQDEPELAARNRKTADTICEAASEAFWRPERGLFADDLAGRRFSEHSQCLALLADREPTSQLRADRLRTAAENLFRAPDPTPGPSRSGRGERIERATIYFSHYLFEICRLQGRTDILLDRLGLWFDLRTQGFVTTFESPEPCRSDCHAWGAHPIFHYFATLIGIRPSAPGFARVRIAPQPGPLTWLRGCMPHPKGEIVADLQFQGGSEIAGSIGLPKGVSGELIWQDRTQVLHEGTQAVAT